MLGCGVLMTLGLFFIFRSLIRQIRAESAQLARNSKTQDK